MTFYQPDQDNACLQKAQMLVSSACTSLLEKYLFVTKALLPQNFYFMNWSKFTTIYQCSIFLEVTKTLSSGLETL